MIKSPTKSPIQTTLLVRQFADVSRQQNTLDQHPNRKSLVPDHGPMQQVPVEAKHSSSLVEQSTVRHFSSKAMAVMPDLREAQCVAPLTESDAESSSGMSEMETRQALRRRRDLNEHENCLQAVLEIEELLSNITFDSAILDFAAGQGELGVLLAEQGFTNVSA